MKHEFTMQKMIRIKFSIDFNFSIDDEDQDCVAVSHGKKGGFVSVVVVRNDTDCPDEQENCFNAAEPVENIQCDGFGSSCLK